MNRTIVFCGLVLAALGSSAFAQAVVEYRGDDRIDPDEVARILAPPPPSPLTRSIRLLDAPKAPAAALSVPVPFAFDSAEIQVAARPQLDAIAAGIRKLAPDRTVLIEGHTDAIGREDYNLSLSQRRADAVRDYLVRQGIDATRLKDVGLGKARPLPGRDPDDPANRRVQFRGG
jgi:outer membrane protein OmpA-like peptidoglycan-associated protein